MSVHDCGTQATCTITLLIAQFVHIILDLGGGGKGAVGSKAMLVCVTLALYPRPLN